LRYKDFRSNGLKCEATKCTCICILLSSSDFPIPSNSIQFHFDFLSGNDENSERDSFENSNSAFDINEDSNMTSLNGDNEPNDGEELENSFDSHDVEGNEQQSNAHDDTTSEQINEDSRQVPEQDGEESNIAASVAR